MKEISKVLKKQSKEKYKILTIYAGHRFDVDCFSMEIKVDFILRNVMEYTLVEKEYFVYAKIRF